MYQTLTPQNNQFQPQNQNFNPQNVQFQPQPANSFFQNQPQTQNNFLSMTPTPPVQNNGGEREIVSLEDLDSIFMEITPAEKKANLPPGKYQVVVERCAYSDADLEKNKSAKISWEFKVLSGQHTNRKAFKTSTFSMNKEAMGFIFGDLKLFGIIPKNIRDFRDPNFLAPAIGTTVEIQVSEKTDQKGNINSNTYINKKLVLPGYTPQMAQPGMVQPGIQNGMIQIQGLGGGMAPQMAPQQVTQQQMAQPQYQQAPPVYQTQQIPQQVPQQISQQQPPIQQAPPQQVPQQQEPQNLREAKKKIVEPQDNTDWNDFDPDDMPF